jgi:hypothetical protein
MVELERTAVRLPFQTVWKCIRGECLPLVFLCVFQGEKMNGSEGNDYDVLDSGDLISTLEFSVFMVGLAFWEKGIFRERERERESGQRVV